MKYVHCLKGGFFLFPESDFTWHSHVAGFLTNRKGDQLLSAGFVKFEDGMPVCHGYSESLEIGSNNDDTELLREQLGLSDEELKPQEVTKDEKKEIIESFLSKVTFSDLVGMFTNQKSIEVRMQEDVPF